MEIHAQFTRYVEEIGYSKGSKKLIPQLVKDFLTYHHIRDVSQITQDHIEKFHQHLQTRPNKWKVSALSESYINHHVYALKVFFNWLETTNQISVNPISNLKFKSPKINTREPLTKEEITILFEEIQNLKELTILHLFYSCGLRRSEAEALNMTDIHFKQHLLYVRDGKGAKRRAVPLTEKVSKEMENYLLHERPNEEKADTERSRSEAFMLNDKGTRMKGDQYNKALKAIIKRTEIKNETSLHHLRHSIATHLLENGLEIEEVRDFLGHSYLESTQIYAKVQPHQLKSL